MVEPDWRTVTTTPSIGAPAEATVPLSASAASADRPGAPAPAATIASAANAIVATAILKQAVNEAQGDLTAALGLYHSHSPKLAEEYREKALISSERLKEPRR